MSGHSYFMYTYIHIHITLSCGRPFMCVCVHIYVHLHTFKLCLYVSVSVFVDWVNPPDTWILGPARERVCRSRCKECVRTGWCTYTHKMCLCICVYMCLHYIKPNRWILGKARKFVHNMGVLHVSGFLYMYTHPVFVYIHIYSSICIHIL